LANGTGVLGLLKLRRLPPLLGVPGADAARGVIGASSSPCVPLRENERHDENVNVDERSGFVTFRGTVSGVVVLSASSTVGEG
jgi:hypothetical protein